MRLAIEIGSLRLYTPLARARFCCVFLSKSAHAKFCAISTTRPARRGRFLPHFQNSPRQSQTASLRMAREGEAPQGLRTSRHTLPESHTKIFSLRSDGASPNSNALIVGGHTPLISESQVRWATTRGREIRTYRQSSRAGGRASTNMVAVLNPTVREPWQKLKEYFVN